MRRSTLLLSLLLAAVPLAAAGPVGLLPGSAHEEGCHHAFDSYTNESWDGENYTSETFYVNETVCASSDTYVVSVGEGAVVVEARDTTWEGNASRYEATYTSEPLSGRYTDHGSNTTGSYERTTLRVSAGGQEAAAQTGCEELDVRTYESDSMWGVNGYGYDDVHTHTTTEGCGESVEVAGVRASRFEGCRGSDVLHMHEEGSSTSADAFCGQQADVGAAGIDVRARSGSGCGNAVDRRWEDNAEVVDSQSACTEGAWVDVGDVRLLLGSQSGEESTCTAEGCTGHAHDVSGLTLFTGAAGTYTLPLPPLLP